jgi:hypothetical protein
MAEVGIGVLFAVWFIAIYLLVSRFRKRGEGWRGPVTLNPLDTAKALEAPGRKRFLTTREMSEHHAPKAGSSPMENDN